MRSSARRVIVRTGRDSPHWEPKLCVASGCFRRDVLRIVLSDFDEGQEEPSLGIILGLSDSLMSIIILSAEPRWWTGFVA